MFDLGTVSKKDLLDTREARERKIESSTKAKKSPTSGKIGSRGASGGLPMMIPKEAGINKFETEEIDMSLFPGLLKPENVYCRRLRSWRAEKERRMMR